MESETGVSTVLSLPHETNELVKLYPTLNGANVSTGVKYAIVATGARPTSWTTAEYADSIACARVSSLAAGNYDIWTQITAGSEVAVLFNGKITLT